MGPPLHGTKASRSYIHTLRITALTATWGLSLAFTGTLGGPQWHTGPSLTYRTALSLVYRAALTRIQGQRPASAAHKDDFMGSHKPSLCIKQGPYYVVTMDPCWQSRSSLCGKKGLHWQPRSRCVATEGYTRHHRHNNWFILHFYVASFVCSRLHHLHTHFFFSALQVHPWGLGELS